MDFIYWDREITEKEYFDCFQYINLTEKDKDILEMFIGYTDNIVFCKDVSNICIGALSKKISEYFGIDKSDINVNNYNDLIFVWLGCCKEKSGCSWKLRKEAKKALDRLWGDGFFSRDSYPYIDKEEAIRRVKESLKEIEYGK